MLLHSYVLKDLLDAYSHESKLVSREAKEQTVGRFMTLGKIETVAQSDQSQKSFSPR